MQRSVLLLQTKNPPLSYMAMVLLGRVPAVQLRPSPCHTRGNGNANATPYHDEKPEMIGQRSCDQL